ncbi:DUF1772 domain-containing protein [Rhodococcus spelaei]|uniref:DUF1772 domain-containing protein n=1 Tax=Rhodococcus spelaei TaxID=2546320 RepID=A0A541BLX8_9NOCA|nr:anthrone oxygenase family protein [Rhodococcus spelaei]TQF73333.1 DUF1772 domain-containing protein [Rhodococcus spelaei]
MFSLIRGGALFGATVCTGLIAGLFYSFAVSVMLGLHASDDRTFVEAMQRINVAILNGWFALAFGGALAFTVLAVGMHLRAPWRPALPWVVAALVLYLVVLVVTSVVNVPLNDDLAAAGSLDHIADLGSVRAHFESTWVRWNVVRAVTSTAAFACLAVAQWVLAVRD